MSINFGLNALKTILITGATGNVGLETIKALRATPSSFAVVAGVRNLEKDKKKLAGYELDFTEFDFADPTTHQAALTDCEVLFLLRPPQLADVDRYFKPLIEQAKKSGLQHLVFLSVQGVENSSIIPHHKIEKLIVESGIPYTFLRPAYFMQNFTTTLREDLVKKDLIFLPAGNTPFALIDVRDIGTVAAQVLTHPTAHTNRAYDLTSDQLLTFGEMARQLSEGLGKKITYRSPSLWAFFWKKKREGTPVGYILVMIMLHYFPRFQKTPSLSDWVEKLAGRKPISFEQFVSDNARFLAV